MKVSDAKKDVEAEQLEKMKLEAMRRREAEILENAARIWADLPENRSCERILCIHKESLMEDGLLSRLTDEEIADIAKKVLAE